MIKKEKEDSRTQRLLYWDKRVVNLELTLEIQPWVLSSNIKLTISHLSIILYVSYQHGSLYNCAGMCQFLYIFAPFVPFFNAIFEEPQWYVILSIAVIQPRLYLQYFLSRLNQSRLYNRACKPYTTAIKCLFSTSE